MNSGTFTWTIRSSTLRHREEGSFPAAPAKAGEPGLLFDLARRRRRWRECGLMVPEDLPDGFSRVARLDFDA